MLEGEEYNKILTFIKDLIPMLTEEEVIDLENFIKDLDEDIDKNTGKKMIIEYINGIISKKIEEESNKIIKYYEQKLEENV